MASLARVLGYKLTGVPFSLLLAHSATLTTFAAWLLKKFRWPPIVQKPCLIEKRFLTANGGALSLWPLF